MKKRVTIKDIAIEAGVSTGTVHRAIYGKKGVGEKVQKRIIDLCLKHGYRINTVASALKRGNLRIVAAFPAPEGKNRFFYSSVWQGFRGCMAELHDYNIEIVELPYYPGTEHDQSEVLFSCYKNYQGEIDALITIGRFDSLCTRVIQTYHEHNIPIFLACDDDQLQTHRLRTSRLYNDRTDRCRIAVQSAAQEQYRVDLRWQQKHPIALSDRRGL